MALVCGEVGLGKTITSRVFVSSLDKEKYNSALILNPVLDEVEFLKELLREFRVNVDKEGSLRDLLEFLQTYLIDEYKKGKSAVCVIDEAQLIPERTLHFIRLLSNFETDKQKLIQIVFFAQKEFELKIKREEFKAIAQRITVKVDLEPLSKDEILPYISYRIFKAGISGTVFCDKSSVDPIYRFSLGVPRLINLICDRALLFLFLHSKNTIDGHVINRVVNEASLRHLFPKKKRIGSYARKSFILSLLFAILLYILQRTKILSSFLVLFWTE